jgi:hypothetical protein
MVMLSIVVNNFQLWKHQVLAFILDPMLLEIAVISKA